MGDYDATNSGGSRKYSSARKREEESKKGPAERIAHRLQDFLLSASYGWITYDTYFNLTMLLLVVSTGRVALENLIKYGILISPLTWIAFFLSDWSLWNWRNLALIIASNITIS